MGTKPVEVATPVAKGAQLVKIILTAIPVKAVTPVAKAVQLVKTILAPI